jgi:hypothetical protein
MRAAVLAGLLAACSAAQTQGETVPLQDSAQGMTCRFHVAGARMAWTMPGGDWLDSSDQRQGLRAFSQALVSPSRVAERVSWPVDTLIRAWGEGRGVQGAVHLRALASGSVIDFASREHPMTIDQPLLRVVWDDGQTDRYTPSADTHLDCSTHGSEGGNTLLKVSGDQDARSRVQVCS